MTKPKVTTNPVANQYAGPNERIVEYSTRSGLGGLIAFRETDDGLTVDLYRHDPKVEVRVSDSDPSGIPTSGADQLIAAIDRIVDAWDGGDLAGAVNAARETADEWRQS